MKIKTNLHFHTSDDPRDAIDYDFYEGADRAAELGFGAIALTCHDKFALIPEYESYASKRNILLIQGIEKDIEKKHAVILNCDRDVEFINTFEELSLYRKSHPEIFIIAPHPYFPASYSLGKKLDQNISLFDAVEHSWFYSNKVNFNKKAEMTAARENLPFLATSDTHFLKLLGQCYAVIDAEEKTPASIFKAIRERKFENATAPAKLWREMAYYFVLGEIKKILQRKKD